MITLRLDLVLQVHQLLPLLQSKFALTFSNPRQRRKVLVSTKNCICLNWKLYFSLPQVENKHSAVTCARPNLVSSAVPTYLKDAASAPVRVDQLPTLSAPYVHTLVEAAAGEELAAGREGNAVHRFLVPACQCVDTGSLLHVPQTH